MLKKTLIAAACMVFASVASAQFVGGNNTSYATQGRFVGPGAQVIKTAAAARIAADDTPVVLEGYITQRLNNDDLYEFKDSTGTIAVDIDNKKWPGEVTPKTKVRLIGEVDKNIMSVEVDVDRVDIISR